MVPFLIKRLPNLSMPQVSATLAFNQLNISIMQFASDPTHTNYTLLLQPLIEYNSPRTFYSWVMLLDWVLRMREVISLEGDNGTFVLMSEAYSISSMTINKGFLTNASTVVYYILVYFTAVMITLGIISTLTSYRCQCENLFFFHQIVGSTWVGRPLMFLRGATAIFLLGSEPIQLKYNGYITRFDFSSRSLLECIVLSSEASWISVVAHELMAPFTCRGARTVSRISTGSAWLICLILDIVSPNEVITKLDHKWRAIDMINQHYCNFGAIEIGSYNRVVKKVRKYTGISKLVVGLGATYIAASIMSSGHYIFKELGCFSSSMACYTILLS
ncbi:hypothetical protein THRCLA_04073 [Thraustotheca clavata]|uniref:Uncharacterized protein n=1 Tax=Thraustotheca clavata TaxID=74557 RepID=A0A1W0A097_9STRA|nr:hypothetical protein THRCLA_04073 [Thraustotheca clavata]